MADWGNSQELLAVIAELIDENTRVALALGTRQPMAEARQIRRPRLPEPRPLSSMAEVAQFFDGAVNPQRRPDGPTP